MSVFVICRTTGVAANISVPTACSLSIDGIPGIASCVCVPYRAYTLTPLKFGVASAFCRGVSLM